jgi:hypothetical protein
LAAVRHALRLRLADAERQVALARRARDGHVGGNMRMDRIHTCSRAVMGRMTRRLAVGILLGVGLVAVGTAGAVPGPWQRTEPHAACDAFNVVRNAYFGDTHVHTTHSVDAVLFNTLNTPRDAYRFALGQPIGLPPYDASGNPARTIQLGRPLDFTAVTDHSEGFGTQSVCFLPGLPGYDSTPCQQLRTASVSNDPTLVQQVFLNLLFPVVLTDPPMLPAAVCGPGPAYADCASRQSLFWVDAQDAAEEFYDRSSACTFTTFVGYEWTGTPGNANLHRNIIFRNATVPALPVSFIEQSKPQNLWAALKAQCQDALPGCDWLGIPHNSNLSGPNGLMFLPENADGSPLTAADAATRTAMEPLVEIYQHKGSSECRPGVDTTDEQCGFEQVNRHGLLGPRDLTGTYPPSAYVRNALKEGLVQEQRIGVNPFRLGIVASTDTHNGSPGNVREDSYHGHVGVNDNDPTILNNQLGLTGAGGAFAEHGSGGLAVVWAEENSRDALFAAMRRRETYGTSGPRHVLRFFAGRPPHGMCSDPDFAATGYRTSATMGAEIGPVRASGPVFTILASKDPGDPGHPGTALQRVQVVKGWVDGAGAAHEKVFDVGGDATQGSVDTTTCTTSGTGFDSLCTSWTDPEFDRTQRAFYYVRALELPTCRWSQYTCNAYGIDCSNPSSVSGAFAACCDATIPKTLQERSWSSPIWYRPEGVVRLRGTVTFGRTPGADRLTLTTRFSAGLAHDLGTEDVRVLVHDDDTILDVTFPAGTLANGPVRNFAGLAFAKLSQRGSKPATLMVRTLPTTLAAADRVDHMVDVEVHVGTFVVEHSRLWTLAGAKLSTK